MVQNTNLAVIKNNNLPRKVKNELIKTAKVVGWSALTFGLITASMLVATAVPAAIPIVSIATLLGAGYTCQRILTDTKYKAYKDLAFITKKVKGNIKIYQDPTRIDILSKIKEYSNKEKIGFMQLQLLCGISRESAIDKNGELITFETDTHKKNTEAIKKLEELGYIQNYKEEFKKKSGLTIAKLAFGNVKGAIDSVNPMKKEYMYNIKFQLTDKQINLDDEELRKQFPVIFDFNEGLIANQNISLNKTPEGQWKMNYNKRSKENHNGNKQDINGQKNKFIESIDVSSELIEKDAEKSKAEEAKTNEKTGHKDDDINR